MSKRGQTVPVAAWWFTAARREMARPIWELPDQEERGALTLTHLAEMLGDIVANVSRCLNGDVTTIHLLIKISDRLGIPRPVFLPQSEQEALVIHGALNLRAADLARHDLERRVASENDADPKHHALRKSRKL